MNDVKRLFIVPPSSIEEHPSHLGLDSIPDGFIDGYSAYAPNFDGDPAAVVGPFDPVVQHEDAAPGDERSGPSAFIEVPDPGNPHEHRFWFKDGTVRNVWDPDRPCWYQSGYKLRFVRKAKGELTDHAQAKAHTNCHPASTADRRGNPGVLPVLPGQGR